MTDGNEDMPVSAGCNVGLDGSADPNDVLEQVNLASLTDSKQRAVRIRAYIREEDARLRAKYSWLAYQNTLGVGIWLFSLAGIVSLSWLYATERLSALVTVVGIAFCGSFLHELEHDLIHDQYLKGHKAAQNVLLTLIWFCKLGAHPWERKKLHLQHHRVSGQPSDVEERLIGLGMPFGLTRLFIMLNPWASYFAVKEIKRDNSAPKFRARDMSNRSLPTYIPYQLGSLISLVLFFFPISYEGPLLSFLRVFAVCLCWPNTLRQFCLVAISTYCHYYGDIPERDVFYQNQILDHWLVLPLNLFCVWFGKTHIIHHYFVPQPFYLRTMCSPLIVGKMVSEGVRRNDLGILRRANRFSDKQKSS